MKQLFNAIASLILRLETSKFQNIFIRFNASSIIFLTDFPLDLRRGIGAVVLEVSNHPAPEKKNSKKLKTFLEITQTHL